MRRAARVDANQAAIVAALRKAGCSVLDLSGVGGGCPDILCGRRGKNLLIEIKDGTKSPSRRSLTGPESEFMRAWQGSAVVITDVYAALDAVQEWL